MRAPALGSPSFTGVHASATWAITGEMRAYNRRSGLLGPLPIARSVRQDGWGAWELGVRWSQIDLTDGMVEGGEARIWSLGLNWWPSPIFNVNLNYRHVTLDRFGVTGTSQGLNGRVLLILERSPAAQRRTDLGQRRIAALHASVLALNGT